jgi:hypothetical protein
VKGHLIWDGPDAGYTEQAILAVIEVGRVPSRWSWVVPSCGTPKCIEPDHLEIHSPQSLDYPPYLCVYCGESAFTRDHLLPRTFTGQADRQFVLTVPACGQCNSILSDKMIFSINERRSFVHARLRQKRQAILRRFDYSAEDLEEFEGRLRDDIARGLEEKATLVRKLAWPIDPGFDRSALARSGIEDGYLLGLIT